MSFYSRLEQRLSERREAHLYRSRKVLASAQAERIRLDGNSNEFLNFCSNDYLGLANHEGLKKHFQNSVDLYGVGSGASHLVIGHHQEHRALEEELAELLGFERALVFGSGFTANTGVLNTILEKDDWVFEDKLNHASLLDGALASGAHFKRYLHNDIDSLNKKISLISDDVNKLIVSDAVFSMDGDQTDIPALVETKKKQDAWLMLDDAHGFGVLGEQGKGSLAHQQVAASDVDVYMATFGKALGTSGAFVAGSETLIESLIQFCRHYIYSTAMPPALASTTRYSLKLLSEESWRMEQLKERIAQFKQGAKGLGFDLLDSDTAIQPILLGSAERAMQWSEDLTQKGILIGAIRPPTVPPNTARLRIALSASHSAEQVDRLLEALDAQIQQEAA